MKTPDAGRPEERPPDDPPVARGPSAEASHDGPQAGGTPGTRLAVRLFEVVGRSLAVLAGLTALTAAGTLFLLTQTVVGRRAAASFAEDALAASVRGDVRIGPILGGNLVTRAHLAAFEISGPTGPFVRLEGVRVEYNPLGFLLGGFRFHDLRAERLELELRQGEDGRWNFERLFEDDEPDDGGPGTTRVLLSDVRLEDGILRVRTPWASEAGGAERDSLIARGLRGDALWRIRRIGPERYERLIELDSLRGALPLVRLVDPVRPMQIEFAGLAAEARVVTQTLPVHRLDAEVVFRDTIAVSIAALELGESALAGEGRIVPEDPPQYAFELGADPFAFADLQWLPLPVPREGGGPAAVEIDTRGEVLVVTVRDGDVRVRDTRLRGGFALALEGTPRFESLDLELRPLRLALVDELLERESGTDGTVTGRVRGRGPIDLLELEADLVLRPPESDVPPSRLGVRGAVGVGVDPTRMRDLRLELEEFELRWSAVVGIPAEFAGRLDGTATFGGTAGEEIEFEADLIHRSLDGAESRVDGGGSIAFGEIPTLDLRFDADPLALSVLDPYVRVDLTGDVRGPISAVGPLQDLRLVADLRTPRGLLNFDGRFDLQSEVKRYDARLLARDIQLRQWTRAAPITDLAVEGRVRGAGTDPETLEASFDLTVLPSRVEGARVDSSLVRFTMREGLATADTFAIRTDVGSVDGRGSFGLAEGRSGSLILDVEAPALASWNRWIVPGRNPVRRDTSIAALFEEFPGGADEQADGEPAAPPDSLVGSLTGRGVLYGSLADFSFGGRILTRDVAYGSVSLDSAQLTVDVPDPRRLDSLVARTSVWQPRGFGAEADSLFLRWRRHDGSTSEVDLHFRRDTTVRVTASAAARAEEGRTRLRIGELEATLGGRGYRLADPAELAWGRGGLEASLRLVADGGGMVTASGAVPDSGSADLDLRVEGLSLAEPLLLFGADPSLSGTLSARARVRGTADSPRWTAGLEVEEPRWFGIGYPALAGDFEYAERTLAVDTEIRGRAGVLGRLTGELGLDLSFRDREERWEDDEPIRLTASVDSMPLEALELQFRTLREIAGFARGEVGIRGRPDALRFDGRARISGGAATVPSLGVRLEQVEGALRFDGSEAHLDSLALRSSGGGSASVTGSVGLEDFADPSFDLELRARRFLGMSRRLATVVIDGRGHLGGRFRSPELTGSFRLSDGEVRAERFLRQRQAVDLTDPDVYSLIDTTVVAEQRLFRAAQNPFMRNLRLEATVAIGPDLWLRSPTIDVELSGELDVRMDRAAGDLTAFGTLSLVRGKYRYVSGTGTDLSALYSRQLQIESGAITFVGTPGLDPNLDIRAEYRTRSDLGPLTIVVHITGTSLNPRLSLSSEPPLPESDRICYLLFSAPCLGVTAQGGEFAASLVREGVLGTVGSQFSQVLVGGIGIVDYLDVRTTGEPQTGTETAPSLLYGTEVEIGRYLGRDLFVTASQPLAGGLPGAAIEWRFLPDWSLEARTEERFRRISLLAPSSNIDTDRTYGLFLYRVWRF